MNKFDVITFLKSIGFTQGGKHNNKIWVHNAGLTIEVHDNNSYIRFLEPYSVPNGYGWRYCRNKNDFINDLRFIEIHKFNEIEYKKLQEKLLLV